MFFLSLEKIVKLSKKLTEQNEIYTTHDIHITDIKGTGLRVRVYIISIFPKIAVTYFGFEYTGDHSFWSFVPPAMSLS